MATRVLRCFSKLGGHDEIIMFSPTNYLELSRAAELKAECGGQHLKAARTPFTMRKRYISEYEQVSIECFCRVLVNAKSSHVPDWTGWPSCAKHSADRKLG
jgi:hypothetical protein